jgi:hypothetical protein
LDTSTTSACLGLAVLFGRPAEHVARIAAVLLDD